MLAGVPKKHYDGYTLRLLVHLGSDEKSYLNTSLILMYVSDFGYDDYDSSPNEIYYQEKRYYTSINEDRKFNLMLVGIKLR